MSLRRCAAAAGTLVLVLTSSCSASDDDQAGSPTSTTVVEATSSSPAATTTSPPPTTTTTPDFSSMYDEPGPFPVGVTTLQLAKGPLVEVWYPAVEGTAGTEIYDVRDFTPDAVKALLTAEVPATFEYTAGRDAAVADGAFPVVLFSHGFTGFRLQSTFLTSHLAGYGMIVVAPDHPSRDMPNVLGGTATGDRADSVDDLLQSLDLITAAGDDPASIFAGHVDVDRVTALGHSAGGGTVLAAALDPRIDGYVSMASGAGRRAASAGSSTTVAATPYPDKPSFFLGGTVDGIVPLEEVTRPAYEAAPAPSLLWAIDGVGHNGFDDFCTFGNGTGIIGVAEANGLGAFLDSQPQLRALGEDGCVPPAVDVATTFPVVLHGVTAWLRWQFGEDAEPSWLLGDVADRFSTEVEIASK